MTNKTTMPEPVAYPSDDWVEAFFGLPDESGFYVFRGDFGNIADRFRIAAKCAGLITTDQAEAYADARVRAALLEAYGSMQELHMLVLNDTSHCVSPAQVAIFAVNRISALIKSKETT